MRPARTTKEKSCFVAGEANPYGCFDGLVSLYVVSAIFGLAQGGLVPSYAVIIRELFPAREAGLRVSLAISTTLAGMALGGWLAGAIYDWTGSYAAALVNGIAWNIGNMAIAFWLLQRMRGRAAGVGTASPPSIGRTRAPTG